MLHHISKKGRIIGHHLMSSIELRRVSFHQSSKILIKIFFLYLNEIKEHQVQSDNIFIIIINY